MNINNLANICVQVGDFEQAIKYYDESLEIKNKIFGEFSNESVLAYNNLGWCYLKSNSYEKAIQNLIIALSIATKTNSIKQCTTYKYVLNNLGLTYLKLNDLVKAEEYLFGALKIFKNLNCVDIHECYLNVALFYASTENFKVAEKYFNDALKLKEKLFGSENFNLEEILIEYALFLKNKEE